MSSSFLRNSLVIPSLPPVSRPEVFCPGLLDLCQELKVWRLQIDTYSSLTVEIPQLPGELERRTRCEFVLDLERGDISDRLSGQHRRSISRAVKAGLRIRRTREASARSSAGKFRWSRHLFVRDPRWNAKYTAHCEWDGSGSSKSDLAFPRHARILR